GEDENMGELQAHLDQCANFRGPGDQRLADQGLEGFGGTRAGGPGGAWGGHAHSCDHGAVVDNGDTKMVKVILQPAHGGGVVLDAQVDHAVADASALLEALVAHCSGSRKRGECRTLTMPQLSLFMKSSVENYSGAGLPPAGLRGADLRRTALV